jgi:hypothetical protein
MVWHYVTASLKEEMRSNTSVGVPTASLGINRLFTTQNIATHMHAVVHSQTLETL